MSFPSESDLSGTIARLFVYPVKSCAGIEVQQARLTETGLDLDRAWMVVDAQGMFLTQRSLPRMALIRPQLKSDEMVLRAPGMLAVPVAIDAVEALSVDPADASPDHWRHVHNRLSAGLEPNAYTPERHAAWIGRRRIEP